MTPNLALNSRSHMTNLFVRFIYEGSCSQVVCLLRVRPILYHVVCHGTRCVFSSLLWLKFQASGTIVGNLPFPVSFWTSVSVAHWTPGEVTYLISTLQIHSLTEPSLAPGVIATTVRDGNLLLLWLNLNALELYSLVFVHLERVGITVILFIGYWSSHL